MPLARYRLPAALLAALLCSACAGGQQPAPAGQPAPSPTVAALIPAPAPAPADAAPTRAPAAPAPTSAPTAPPLAIATADPARFAYLWPAYLPQGMQPSPAESRVAGENEIGRDSPGFYLVTFSGDGGRRKIVLGGGSVQPLSIPAPESSRAVTLDGRQATLATSGDQRLLTFSLPASQGALFLFAAGVSEQDLFLVAESLLPVDQADMRQRAGVK